MITKFLKDTTVKYFTKYLNLPPKQRALADMFGYLLLLLFCSGVVVITVYFNLFFELAMLMVAYGIFGLLRVLYQSKVAQYEWQEKYGNK